jgi:predicted AlkP superfamily phosphohydrolase/phosphomutase
MITVGCLGAFGCSRDEAKRPSDTVRAALQPFLEKPGEPRHRVLLIGWDGATYDMIDPLIAAGKLPNLKRLMDEGLSLELESTMIPISAEAWTAAVTGKGPPKTGIFSFFTRVRDSYAIRLISSRDRRTPTVWNFLNHRGLKTHVVGVPITYPPEPIDGVMIAGMLSPLDAEYAHPPGLADALRNLGFVPDIDVWRNKQEQEPEEMVAEQHALKVRLTTSLLKDSDWDFAMIVFKCLDVLCHRLYTGAADGPVPEHYERLDDALGQLRHAAGPNTDVLLMSDHGFGVYPHMLSITACLVEAGLATLSPVPGRQTVPEDEPQAKLIPVVHLAEIGRLDMSKTLVFCDSTEGNYAGLRLNLQGREPAGIVAPEQREAVTDEIISKLSALRETTDGPPVFTRVMRTSDVYRGPHADDVPDILLEADRKFACKPWHRVPLARKTPRPTADHALIGVLAAAGPSFNSRPERGHASILDVTPTVLQLFSLPVPNQMDGRVLTEILSGDVRVVRVDEQELDLATEGEHAYETDEARQVIQRLKSLGYVDDEPDEESEPEVPAP